MDNHPNEEKSAASEAAPSKRAYEAPTLLEWGTLRDITQRNGDRGKSDGGRRPYNKTR